MIHYDVSEPELSPYFTVDDIHKIREWHYEMMKGATVEECINFYYEGALEFKREMEELRREKQKTAQL